MSLLTKCEKCRKNIKVSMNTITGMNDFGVLSFFCSNNCKEAVKQSKRKTINSCKVKVYLLEEKITINTYPVSMEKIFILTIAGEYNGIEIDYEHQVSNFTEVNFGFKSFDKALLFIEFCKKVPGVEAEIISLENS